MLLHICCIVVQPSAPASVFLVLWVAFMLLVPCFLGAPWSSRVALELLVSMFFRCFLVLQGCALAAGFHVFSVLPGPLGLRSCCWFPCLVHVRFRPYFQPKCILISHVPTLQYLLILFQSIQSRCSLISHVPPLQCRIMFPV